MNIDIFKSKYNKLVPETSKEDFLRDIEAIKEELSTKVVNYKVPLLIYADNRRNAIFYMTALVASISANRVMDYTIVTGQTISREHFANSAKDLELEALIYNNDILFISLSQFDYTSQYVESLIIDIIEYRKDRGLITIIHYDIIGSADFLTTTNILHTFFKGNGYQVVTLRSTPVASKVKASTRKGRII